MKSSPRSLVGLVLILLIQVCSTRSFGQAGTSDNQVSEFKTGWSGNITFGFGGEHAWHNSETVNPYYNSLQFTERFTFKGNLFRAGLGLGVLYDGKVNAYGGPQVSIRVYSLNVKSFGNSGIGNVQIQLDNYYGTNSIVLLGGGVVLELGNLLNLSIKNYYEFNSKQPWSLFGLGINLRGKQKKTDSDHF